MIKKYHADSYETQLRLLGASENVIAAKKACITDALKGFEASSRSVSMLCHSHKMGGAQKVGSKIENAGRLSDEINPLVEGYFFKVGELTISYKNNDGGDVSIRHRPDCLRLLRLPETIGAEGFDSTRFLRFAEYKSSSALKDACGHSERYVFDPASNRYRCPSAEVAAAQLGLGYDVLTEGDIDATVVSNCELLHTYFDARAEAVPPAIVTKAREVVAAKQGLSIAELMADTPGLTKDRFYAMLCTQKLFVPLGECHLDLPSTVQVFSDSMSYEAFATLVAPRTQEGHRLCRFPAFNLNELVTIRGKKYTVVAPSPQIVQFRDDQGGSTVMTRNDLERLVKDGGIVSLGVLVNAESKAREILLSTSPAKLKSAVDRLAILQPVLDGHRPAKSLAQLPNWKEWLQRARKADIQYSNPLIGCIDFSDRQGWRGSHISETSEELITEIIQKSFVSTLASKKAAAYGEYRRVCKERGRAPVSSKTFRARIARYAADEVAKNRAGAMAAAAQEKPVSEETLLYGGGRYFLHVGHMDEFIFDLSLIFPELGLALGAAWISGMVDSFTRTVLAVIISFEAPSYVTTMMVLRECVTRWGRLPEILFMDNGPGYKNTSLVLFAKYYGVQLCWRPPGKPRWGGSLERFGGDSNQRVADELPGATKILNKYRRLSKSHHPDTLAIFGLQAIAEVYRNWAYNEFDNLPHGGLNGRTPRAEREISLADHGARLHLKISDDPLFHILSLPAPEGDGKLKVQAHDGIQVSNLYYWHPKFHDPLVVGTYVDARWDPFDVTRAYAYVGGEWIECNCTKLLKLRRLSKEDLCAASLEIRKGRSDYNRQRDSIQERVAAFLDATRKSGEELAHLLKTKESARQFLSRITPPSFDDDSPSENAVPGTPPPKPNIPGFAGNNRSTKGGQA